MSTAARPAVGSGRRRRTRETAIAVVLLVPLAGSAATILVRAAGAALVFGSVPS